MLKDDLQPNLKTAPLGDVEPHAYLLAVPSGSQLLYKMLRPGHLISSIEGRYLHFNRVDRYFDFDGADHFDGDQPPSDLDGNSASRFEKVPEFSVADYYRQSRGRTYACCFSTENSDFIWRNYANGGNKGKVCLVFDFDKLRDMLNGTLAHGQAALMSNGVRCQQIFSINYGLIEYVDWDSYKANIPFLPNPIRYTFVKAKKYSDERELRISLSAFGMGTFKLGNGADLQFPDSLQMAFDYQAAFGNGTIKEIQSSPDCDRAFLESELHRLSLNPVMAPSTA